MFGCDNDSSVEVHEITVVFFVGLYNNIIIVVVSVS